MKKTTLIILLTGWMLCGCKNLADLVPSVPLSRTEMTEGLKAALEKGTATAISTASSSATGYLTNEAIKILLPPEVLNIQQKVQTSPLLKRALALYLGSNAMKDPFAALITAMNKGAESAAKKASPVFLNAIQQMSITDALQILRGGDTAATTYFKNKTKVPLQKAFQPKVEAELAQTQANTIYQTIAGFVNAKPRLPVIGTPVDVSRLLGMQSVPPTLDAYATEKAIDGLYHLVGQEERKIRKNPLGYARKIIQKVFNSKEAKG